MYEKNKIVIIKEEIRKVFGYTNGRMYPYTQSEGNFRAKNVYIEIKLQMLHKEE